MGKAKGLMDALYGFKPTPARTAKERDDEQQKYYEKLQGLGGPDIYADYEKLLKEDRASSADDLKESRRMAILSAIPAMLKGNDFATAAGEAFGAYAQGRSEGNKANKASQRAAAKELLGLASGRRQEKIGYLKDAQAYSAAMDKALAEGNTKEFDRLAKLMQLETGMLKATKPQRAAGGGAPKGYDALAAVMFEGMVAGGAPRNAITKSDAYIKAATMYGKGDRVSIAEDTAQLARSSKLNDAVINAKKAVRVSGPYGQATPAQQKKMLADAEAEVVARFGQGRSTGNAPAPNASPGTSNRPPIASFQN
jgi:hypothetical protein